MANILTVKPEELTASASDLAAISSEMKTITNNMTTLVDNLKASWPDENGMKFAERFETEIVPKFSTYYNNVQQYSDFVNGASQTYRAKSESVESTINRTSI